MARFTAEEVQGVFVRKLVAKGMSAVRAYVEVGGWTPFATRALYETAKEFFPGSTVAAKGIMDAWKRSEYLSLDVAASQGKKDWGQLLFAGEVENDVTRTPYSAWKVLATNATLRVVVGYWRKRKTPSCFEHMVENARRVREEYGAGTLVLLGANALARPTSVAELEGAFHSALIR